ncbi:MAG: flavin reductase family protein [Leucobacter sp.]
MNPPSSAVAESIGTATPVPATADTFKAVFRHHPGGAALITAHADGRHAAFTVSSLASVSAEPPVVMFSVSSMTSSAPVLADSETVVVHMIDAEQIDLAQIGATSGIDRFAQEHRWVALPSGERVFHEAPVWFRARIEQRVDVGGSTICVARLLESNLPTEDPGSHPRGSTLVYVDRVWHRLGEHSRIG